MEMSRRAGYIRSMDKKPKRPRDPNQLAKLMVDIASGKCKDSQPQQKKDELTKSPEAEAGTDVE